MQIKPISILSPLYKFYLDNWKAIVIYVAVFYVAPLFVKLSIDVVSIAYSQQIKAVIQMAINSLFNVAFLVFIFKKLNLEYDNNRKNRLIVVAIIYFIIVGIIDNIHTLFIPVFYASNELLDLSRNLLLIFISFSSYFILPINYTKKEPITKTWNESFQLAKENPGTIIVLYAFFAILTILPLLPIIVFTRITWFHNFIYSNSIGIVMNRIFNTSILGIILSMRIFAKCVMYNMLRQIKETEDENGI